MNTPEKKTRIAVAIIVAVGVVLLALILKVGKSAPESAGDGAKTHTEQVGKVGPHGGKLFTKGDFGVEVLLAEENGAARHRVWLFDQRKQIAPGAATVTEVLRRPLGAVEHILFAVDKDSQVSTVPIAEPHIFKSKIEVRRGDASMQITLDSEEGKIEINDAQLNTAGITIASAAPASISSAFELSGEIRFNEDRTAHIVPRLAGVVESVSANIGQLVKKGQLLAVVASADISQLRSDLLSAQRRQELAEVTYSREKQLWLDKISAEQDYLQAQQVLREADIHTRNARQKLLAVGATPGSAGALNRFELRAPFAGAIVEKHIAPGESVKEDAIVFKISDLSSVWADINVPAKDLGAVRVGEKATVKATSLAQSASGTVTYVGTLLGEQTRTAKATVTLDNPDNAWRPGLFVNIELTADKRDVAVAVRSEAIQTVADKPTVFVRIDGGFIAVPVQIGRSDGTTTEIVRGMKAGTPYAAQGSFVLKAEQGKGSAGHGH
ncbi:efflux RND transporter periplasmic adaptor subunit [Massilia sp. DWR3-1-1]|uniref:efflux RND transporter periplasmic adaptor subunit n=1 Tax=Massilia sp. DWR3-1-1 TaxID=2804559 RepID=UPI003CF1A676